MFYVYCLTSAKNKRFHYYGFTSNIDQRLAYHQSGKVTTTKRFLPINLLGFKTFISKEQALVYEKALKTKASYRKAFITELESSSGSPA